MSVEFTGERVIPGQVDADLWNEHLSRYTFAARLAPGKRVLDIGCGAGYGSSELSHTAASVVGIDISEDAVQYARERYGSDVVSFRQASASNLPFAENSFDLIVAFEVIEHLSDWPVFLAEARRVLAPSGHFIVSTPNKSYYADSRRLSGPNPFHEHEFEYEEFRQALLPLFPYVTLFTQNHAACIAFRMADDSLPVQPGLHLNRDVAPAAEAHFFLAVCGVGPEPSVADFIYVPSSANVLRERERHIEMLEAEVAELQRRHSELVSIHDEQTAELKRSNQWAAALDQKLGEAGDRIVQLQHESQRDHAAFAQEVARLNTELQETHRSAQEEFDRLERLVEERTVWAQTNQAVLDGARASRWIRLGRRAGLGPDLG